MARRLGVLGSLSLHSAGMIELVVLILCSRSARSPEEVLVVANSTRLRAIPGGGNCSTGSGSGLDSLGLQIGTLVGNCMRSVLEHAARDVLSSAACSRELLALFYHHISNNFT